MTFCEGVRLVLLVACVHRWMRCIRAALTCGDADRRVVIKEGQAHLIISS